MAIEIVDLPIGKMMIFQFANCNSLPEGNLGFGEDDFSFSQRVSPTSWGIDRTKKILGGFQISSNGGHHHVGMGQGKPLKSAALLLNLCGHLYSHLDQWLVCGLKTIGYILRKGGIE
jgi:hypothetical protein